MSLIQKCWLRRSGLPVFNEGEPVSDRRYPRSEAAIARHNQKWTDIYQATAEVRRNHPEEFRTLRAENTYIVSLRLLREMFPHEYRVALGLDRPTSRPQPTPSLRCSSCGELLAEHRIGQCL